MDGDNFNRKIDASNDLRSGNSRIGKTDPSTQKEAGRLRRPASGAASNARTQWSSFSTSSA
jgi:hypothetical protein